MGKDQKNFFMRHKILSIILAIALIAIINSALKGTPKDNNIANDTTAQSTIPSTQQGETKITTPAPKDASIKAGMYKVGTDIQPGEYVVTSTATTYVEVAKDSTGALESIIMNDNFTGRIYVTIVSGQYFSVKGAGVIYPADKAPKAAPKDNKLMDGQYKTGVDIDAGEYKVHSDSGGYVEVSKDSTHILESIITNDNFTGDKYITIANGQYITIKNGYILLSK